MSDPASSAKPTLLFRIYRRATAIVLPFAYRTVARKLAAQGVPDERIAERQGHATLPRPDAPLIWFHAASVGESLSVLTLIERLGERLGAQTGAPVEFLITSGTATSAALIAKRLPPHCRHQFAPLDAPDPVARFLAHWRPDAGVFVESEFWPLMLVRARGTGARLVLLNARLSKKSVRGWKRWPVTARFVLDQFDLMLTQNRDSAQNLLDMGADAGRVEVGANLKATSAPLPVDKTTLDQLRASLKGRPVWVASSTHPGEEEMVLAAHRQLLSAHPGLCLVLVPRHPERGADVAALVADAGFSCARRTAGSLPKADTQVYLADTLGETGTWYALSPIVLLGGSLMPIGGHNPFEPAQAGAAVLTGPHVTNFTETFVPLIAQGGAVEVTDAPSLAAAVGRWLEHGGALAGARDAARAFVAQRQLALDGVVDRLCAVLLADKVDD